MSIGSTGMHWQRGRLAHCQQVTCFAHQSHGSDYRRLVSVDVDKDYLTMVQIYSSIRSFIHSIIESIFETLYIHTPLCFFFLPVRTMK